MSSTISRTIVFFVLACAFTWFGWAGNALFPSDLWPLPMNPLGPLMAAPIAILAFGGRAGLKAWGKRLIAFRAPAWVYATAVLGPLAVIVASTILTVATGAATQPLPAFGVAEFLILIPIMLLAGPAPEELSFRGYAQHELQRAVSPLAAALLIGVGVVVWHAPLLILGDLAWPWAICIVAVSVVYAWIYNQGGSIWPVVAVHFTVNYFGGEYLGSIIAEPSGQFVYSLIHMGFYLAWAGWIALIYGPSLSGRRAASLSAA